MSKFSSYIIRLGMAITFLWIGVLIFRNPEAWAGYIQPWAANFLLAPIKTAMLATAVLDITVGVLFLASFLARPLLWLAALLGSFHLVVVLAVSGITAITVRDIGLLAAAVALFIESFPLSLINNKK